MPNDHDELGSFLKIPPFWSCTCTFCLVKVDDWGRIIYVSYGFEWGGSYNRSGKVWMLRRQHK